MCEFLIQRREVNGNRLLYCTRCARSVRPHRSVNKYILEYETIGNLAVPIQQFSAYNVDKFTVNVFSVYLYPTVISCNDIFLHGQSGHESCPTYGAASVAGLPK